jgi:hypothetical protein
LDDGRKARGLERRKGIHCHGSPLIKQKTYIAHNSKIYLKIKPLWAERCKMKNINLLNKQDGSIDGDVLFSLIYELFKRHIDVNPVYLDLATLWVIATHGVKHAKYAPIFALTSPIPGCGKSTGAELLYSLSCNPVFTSSITAAGIIRTVSENSCTLLLDEADNYLEGNKDMIGAVNNLFTNNGAGSVRCNQEKGYTPERFDGFAFVAIAKIGSLPPAIKTRAIHMNLHRTVGGNNLKKFNGKDEYTETLRTASSQWMEGNGATLDEMEFPRLGNKNPRDDDKLEFLLAIAQLLGPETAKKFENFTYPGTSSSSAGDRSLSVEFLEDCRWAFQESKKDRLGTKELILTIETINDSPYWNGARLTDKLVAKHLAPFDICSQPMRIDGKPRRGFKLEDFEPMFERYLDPLE